MGRPTYLALPVFGELRNVLVLLDDREAHSDEMSQAQCVVSPKVLPVEKRSALFIAAGLIAFPISWMLLVFGQASYFGPMRSLFTKITRRYLDTLPFGWALFDVLYYLLPATSLVLVAIGLSTKKEVNVRYVLLGGFVSVLAVVVLRVWSPAYL